MSRPGKMYRRVLIEAASSTESDEYGTPVETWDAVATVWAELVPKQVAERVIGPALTATTADVWMIRWRADVTPLQRLTYNGTLYDITGVQEVGRRKGLMVTTTARAA